MAYIEPNSTLHLLAGINIDQDYNHTLFFQSRAEQAAFFLTKARKSCQNLTYTRKGRGVLRIDCVPEEVYGCNYMMYKNTAFNPQDVDRWIYAFVEKVEYVNNKCAEVYFTVDRMQTWMFDYVLGDCLVDREHTLTDTVDEYITPEPVFPFEVTIDNDASTFLHKNFSFFAATVVLQRKIKKWGGDPVIWLDPLEQIGTSGGNAYFYVGLAVNDTPLWHEQYFSTFYSSYSLPIDGRNPTLSVFLKNLADGEYEFEDGNNSSINDLADIFIYPRQAFEKTYLQMIGDEPQYSSRSLLVDRPRIFTYANTTYTPRNAKLLSSPYTSLNISSLSGEAYQLRYELFTGKIDNKYAIRLQTNIIGPGISTLSPRYYLNTPFYCMTTLSINHPLMVYYQNSNIADYLRNNKIGMIASAVKTGAEIVGGLITFGITSQGASALSSSADALMQSARGYKSTGRIAKKLTREANELYADATRMETKAIDRLNEDTQSAIVGGGSDLIGYALGALQAKINSNKVFGGTTDGNTEATFERQGYYCYATIPVIESAKQIDDYFDRFGYKLLTTHRPYIDEAKTGDRPVSVLRKVWNYIKTVDCVVHHADNNSITVGYSAEDESIIASIYNKGITFWFNNDIIGEYNAYRGANSIFNPSPTPPTPTPEPFPDNVLSGIDISRWQSSCDPYNPDIVYGVMDVEGLLSIGTGPQFCIMRAGGSDGADGSIFIDPVFLNGRLNNGNEFTGYLSQAIGAQFDRPQVKIGIYWATAAENIEEIQNEMAYLHDILDNNGYSPRVADLGIFLDLELARTLNTGAANCDAIYRTFAEIVSGWGCTPWLYTFRSALESKFLSQEYRNGTFHVAISAPYNEDPYYVGTPPTEAIDSVSSGSYSFISTYRNIWQYGKSDKWQDYNGARIDGDYFYWKGVSQ